MAEDLFSTINKPENPNNLTDLEKKHIPIIEAPNSVAAGESFKLTVHVGKLLTHPNEPGHHIQWVVLLNGSLTLAIVHFTPSTTQSKVSLEITLDKTSNIRALSRCNLHGEWEYSKTIKA